MTFGNELTTANLDSDLMSGTKYFYFSPDGNFFFGGDPEDTDFIVGVRQGFSGSFAAQIPYYTGGLFQDDSQVSNCDCAWLNSTYGGYDPHRCEQTERFWRISGITWSGRHAAASVEDYTYSEQLNVSGSTYSDFYNEYFFGPGGTFAIGFANASAGFLGIEVLMEGPGYTPAPTSATLYLSDRHRERRLFRPLHCGVRAWRIHLDFRGQPGNHKLRQTPRLPTGLGGVQVLVNGTPTAVRYVSPGQVNAVIPLDVDSRIASIQVVNSLGTSNTVSNYVGEVQPGIFNSATSAPAVFHGNNTIVSASNPAVSGEELAVYLTGLGTLDSSGNATSVTSMSVDFSGVTGAINYAGIEPGTPPAVGADTR